MLSKKKSLKDCKLYVILDRQFCKNKIFKIAKETIRGGADIIQYRDKSSPAEEFFRIASGLNKICRKNNIPFIVNDRLEAALRINSAGVHLGPHDFPIELARKLYKGIIGFSCRDYRLAKESKRFGIDYFGTGAFFKTATKWPTKRITVNEYKKIASLGKLTFAIGGINCRNLKFLRKKGVRRVAVCSAICKSKDPRKITAALKGLLN